MKPPFNKDFRPKVGYPDRLHPNLIRIVAPNASKMTFTGTNTYMLGSSHVVVIDPGPDNNNHLRAILNASGSNRIQKILLTHSHIDHTELVPRLKQITGAKVYAHAAGQKMSSQKYDSNASPPNEGGEGIDQSLVADKYLHDGDVIQNSEWSLETIWTPGHLIDHVCFAWREGEILFSGDHIMGWSTTLISPPHGNLTQFMASLDRLKNRHETQFYPGHGDVVSNPQNMVQFQIFHRKEREQQILSGLQNGSKSAFELAKEIYTDIPANLVPMATRNVFAHLQDLQVRGIVQATVGVDKNTNKNAKFSLF